MTGYLIGAGAIAVVWLLTIFKAVLWGSARERDKQAAKERDSYAQHLKDLADAANARPSGGMSDDPNNRDR
jgi:hypothetical protein